MCVLWISVFMCKLTHSRSPFSSPGFLKPWPHILLDQLLPLCPSALESIRCNFCMQPSARLHLQPPSCHCSCTALHFMSSFSVSLLFMELWFWLPQVEIVLDAVLDAVLLLLVQLWFSVCPMEKEESPVGLGLLSAWRVGILAFSNSEGESRSRDALPIKNLAHWGYINPTLSTLTLCNHTICLNC